MRLSRLLLSSVLLVAPIAANAETLLVTLTGQEKGSFYMDSSPVITSDPIYSGEAFFITPVSPLPPSLVSFEFFDASQGGGFADALDGAGYAGPVLFTGTDTDPVFAPGFFELRPFGVSTGDPDERITFTATPEPSSLMLLGTGALGLAGAIRRRLSK